MSIDQEYGKRKPTLKIEVVPGDIQEQEVGAIVLNLFEGAQPGGATKAVDQALDNAIGELIESGDFTGKADQVAVLYSRGGIPARRVILVGLGSQEEFGAEAVRRAAASAAQKARALKVETLATILHGAGAGGLSVEEAAQATAEGSLLGTYSFHGRKSKPPSESLPERLQLVIFDPDDVDAALRGVEVAQAIAAGVTLTRDLVNLPPNVCTPDYMARVAAHVAKETGMRAELLERRQMESLNMGALLAVAQGSDTPPRFIILEHNGGRAEELDTVVLVGKGVTFDTGGYTLKSKESMKKMKTDMAGAAAVIGTMRTIGMLGLELHVVGLAPAADNMISGHAYRPEDVVTASNGTTIEIVSTDAEGRMLLADSLVYAARFDPSAVIDIATLTGASVVALGRGMAAGLFSTDDGLQEDLLAAGKESGERLWPLPLFPEYEKSLKSDTADIKNSGSRMSGVGSSATFLKHFVTYPAWAHIDMAGMAAGGQDIPYVPGKETASGFGVRLLTAFLRRRAGHT